MEIKIGNKTIGPNRPTFIIAEAGSNHDGDLTQAFKLIDVAVKAGADAIKFQIFHADKLYPKNCGNIELGGKKLDLYGFLKDHEVDYKWISKLKKYCDNKGIIFFASAFDEASANELYKNHVSVFKIASSELNHIPLIKHVAKKHKPIILSDGLSTLSDIEFAIQTVRDQGNNNIAILHCLSAYPAPLNEFNLNFIRTLIDVFDVIAGISDHSTDSVLIPTLAVCNGASIVEKHFTLSKSLPGADHFYALEPTELTEMVKKIREVEKYTLEKKKKYISKHPEIMGGYQKVIASCEREIYPGDKRWVFTVKAIKKGERFTKRNIQVLRAERHLTPGIHPKYYELLLGTKSNCSMKAFQGVTWKSLFNK